MKVSTLNLRKKFASSNSKGRYWITNKQNNKSYRETTMKQENLVSVEGYAAATLRTLEGQRRSSTWMPCPSYCWTRAQFSPFGPFAMMAGLRCTLEWGWSSSGSNGPCYSLRSSGLYFSQCSSTRKTQIDSRCCFLSRRSSCSWWSRWLTITSAKW